MNKEEHIEKILLDWLKSGNENTTHCAHLISEYVSSLKKDSPKAGDQPVRDDITFDRLMQISEQVLKANHAGVHEIKVSPSDVVTTDGIGMLFLSTRDYEMFKKIKDLTKD